MSNESEPILALYRPGDEAVNELRSPPRIRRLQNGRSNYDGNDSGSNSSDIESVHSSVQLPCHQNLNTSSESRSPSGVILPSTSPPRSSSGTNCDITEFRRRLEIIKERRARQLSQHVMERNSGNCPTAYGQQCESSATVDEDLKSRTTPSLEASPIEKTEPFSLLNDSTASTCQTFDEITLDTTMDSTKIWQNSPRGHRLPLSPPSISSGHSRKGNDPHNNALKLRRLMCTSSQKKIDANFAQMRHTISNTARTSTANDSANRHYREMTNANGTCDGHAYMGAEEFRDNTASSTITSFNTRENGSLDRLLCTKPRSPGGKQLESSSPKTKDECMDFQDGFPNISINHATRSPDRSRQFLHKNSQTLIPSRSRKLQVGPRDRQRVYSVIGSDEQNSQQQKQQITEINKIDTISRRNISSFRWFRKDPWYLRPADGREGGDEIMADNDNTNNKLLDRMMHAVVFVTEN